MDPGADARTLDYPIAAPSALEPPEEWARLRGRCPVAPVRLPSGDQATLMTRYDDVRQVLSDPRFTRRLDASDAARLSDTASGGVFNSPMSSALPQSGEGHRRWRLMVSKWFTAKRMTALRPRIEAMADELIDRMVESGMPADLKAALGFPLPVWVICDLLGVPDSDRDRFSYWSDALLNLTRHSDDEMASAQTEFVDYMSGHVRDRRDGSGDDLLGELARATDEDGEGFTEGELVATGMGLLIAGHETTANMIGKMTAMLLADRSRWERLQPDDALIRAAVEEALRYDANSGFGMPRYLSDEAEVGGGTLPRGTTVVCSMAAANRDEAAFDGAAEMDLGRSPNPHLAFGAGPHSCLGQALARTELQTVLKVLLRRLPGLELAVPAADLRRVEGLVVGGLAEVPVRW